MQDVKRADTSNVAVLQDVERADTSIVAMLQDVAKTDTNNAAELQYKGFHVERPDTNNVAEAIRSQPAFDRQASKRARRALKKALKKKPAAAKRSTKAQEMADAALMQNTFGFESCEEVVADILSKGKPDSEPKDKNCVSMSPGAGVSRKIRRLMSPAGSARVATKVEPSDSWTWTRANQRLAEFRRKRVMTGSLRF